MLTGFNTPVEEKHLNMESSKMTVDDAVKLFKTALVKLNQKASDSKSFEHDHFKADSSLATDEDDLLQGLLEVSPNQEHKDASIQVGEFLGHDSGEHLKDNDNSNLITEINMPKEFQRFLKNSALAKADSFGQMYKKDWSVRDVGTIDYFDLNFHVQRKVESLTKTADVFANIRSELCNIAYRAKETVLVESLQKPISGKQAVSSQLADTSEDFQLKINRRLQQLALTDSCSSSKKQEDCSKITLSETPVLTKTVSSIPKEEDLENAPVDMHSKTNSLPVKVTVSENHFSMSSS